MISNPSTKYQRFVGVSLPDRQWPNNFIVKPPIWMSTDLRDGNQALIDPMSVATKLRMFASPFIDIGTALMALSVLIVTGVLASLLPAIKAASVNPIVALQDE